MDGYLKIIFSINLDNFNYKNKRKYTNYNSKMNLVSLIIKNNKIYIIILNIIFLLLFNIYFKKIKKTLYESFKFTETLQKKLNFTNEFNKIYSDLYFMAKSGKALKPESFNNSKHKKHKNYLNTKNRICLCTIAKKENIYAREFIEYYRLLGFNKIIIFDNNEISGEKFDYILGDYIKNNFVEILDIRGLSYIQIPVHNYCYKKYSHLYDWIAFLDFDEYIYIKNNSNINNYLYDQRFKNCQSIILNLYLYDDNNLEIYDNRTLIERFKTFKTIKKKSKSIVRGSLPNLIFPSVHVCAKNIDYFCDSTGKRIFPKSYIRINLSKNYMAYIKHFYTKTAEELCIKLNRGDAQFKDKTFTRIRNFFAINTITENKIKIIENCTHLNLTKLIKRHNYSKKKKIII